MVFFLFCFVLLINLGTIISLRATQIMSGIFFLMCGFPHCNLSLHVFWLLVFFCFFFPSFQHMVKVMETGV